MPVAMSDVIQYVMFRINEIGNSNIAAAYSDNAGTVAIDNADGITRAFNDAKNLACRSYWPVKGVFTAAVLQNIYSQEYLALTPAADDPVYPTPTGSYPWWADSHGVMWTNGASVTTTLQYAGPQVIQAYNADYQNTIDATKQGTPLYFYRLGTEAIGLAPVPNAAGTLTLPAWMIPADVTSTSTVAWLPTQEWRPFADMAALMILMKASNDAQIQQRFPQLAREFDELALNRYMSIPIALRNSASGAAVPFPTPPVPISGGGG